jgi:hypothetical protein
MKTKPYWTVGDLIANLKAFPQDMPLAMSTDPEGNGYYAVQGIEQEENGNALILFAGYPRLDVDDTTLWPKELNKYCEKVKKWDEEDRNRRKPRKNHAAPKKEHHE